MTRLDQYDPLAANRPTSSGLIIGVIGCYTISFAYLWMLQFITPNMPGTDGYFHIKMAYLLRTEGVSDAFPWAQLSLWRDHYFDKDFGFHVFLIPFTYGDLIFGAKSAAVVLGAGFFASFYAVVRLSGVRWAAFWVFILLISGGYFLWRVNVPRPQILSMIFSLWAIHFILRRSRFGTFSISMLYALSYTAPHVTVIYAVIYNVASRITQRKWVTGLIIAALAGWLFGWWLHPHFPQNFVAWYIQIIGVLESAWHWNSQTPDLGLGGELSAADTRSMFIEHLPIYVCVVAAICALPYRRKTPGTSLLTLFLLANAFFILTCLSRRFVEYSAPLALWTCALVFADIDIKSLPSTLSTWFHSKWKMAVVISMFLAATVAVGARSHDEISGNFARINPSRVDAGARWIAEHANPDETVFTCDWDDAPELFHFNHDNRYLVFLDPNYLYRWDAEKWRTWNRIANGRHRAPVDTIQREYGARFGYCTNNFDNLRRQLVRDPRVRIISDFNGYYIFEIEDKSGATPDYQFKVSGKTDFDIYGNRKQQLLATPQSKWLENRLSVHKGWFTDLRPLGTRRSHACIELELENFSVMEETTLYFGSDDDGAIWRDGELIHYHLGSRPAKAGQDTIVLKPKRDFSPSTLQFRICQERGDWGFYFEHES